MDKTKPQKKAKDKRDSKATGEGSGVQSIKRAFAILEQVGLSAQGLALAELSKRVGLHTSTTFHLIQTMVQLGHVRQDPETKQYHIGARLFTLASGALNENLLVRMARPILEDLSADTGENAHLAMRIGNEVVAVAQVAGTGSFQMNVGNTRPAHATALGKVLMADLSSAQLDAFLEKDMFPQFTPKTITDADVLRSELEAVRQTGIAYDDCEYNPEARCLAAPVRDFSGRTVAAIGVSGPIWRMSLQRLKQLDGQVSEAARLLSSTLGERPFVNSPS